MLPLYKRSLVLLMIFAMAFGFFHNFTDKTDYDFERLHIFLFNLCAGGSLLLFHTRRRFFLSIVLFLILALIFALSAFFNYYLISIISAVLLGIIVEHERIRRFSLFPKDFFKASTAISEKFHQAALLCLSMGLFISALVMYNENYAKWIYIRKLELNTFFLGFSFPVSLITMSLMFELINKDDKKSSLILNNTAFWAVNLGVIVFFIFILLEVFYMQLAMAFTLFFSVILIFLLFLQDKKQAQEKAFLSSGMFFLVFTGISGIAYIVMTSNPTLNPLAARILLKIHSFASLYGWNLSGMAVILRSEDFPIRLNSKVFIAAHWLVVLILAPLAYFYKDLSIAAVISYIILLYILFFTPGRKESF